jgi:hypothetical protein
VRIRPGSIGAEGTRGRVARHQSWKWINNVAAKKMNDDDEEEEERSEAWRM